MLEKKIVFRKYRWQKQSQVSVPFRCQRKDRYVSEKGPVEEGRFDFRYDDPAWISSKLSPR